MPLSPVVVNGFVQISVAKTTTPGYVSMAQDSTSFARMNTAYSQEKSYSLPQLA